LITNFTSITHSAFPTLRPTPRPLRRFRRRRRRRLHRRRRRRHRLPRLRLIPARTRRLT